MKMFHNTSKARLEMITIETVKKDGLDRWKLRAQLNGHISAFLTTQLFIKQKQSFFIDNIIDFFLMRLSTAFCSRQKPFSWCTLYIHCVLFCVTTFWSMQAACLSRLVCVRPLRLCAMALNFTLRVWTKRKKYYSIGQLNLVSGEITNQNTIRFSG